MTRQARLPTAIMRSQQLHDRHGTVPAPVSPHPARVGLTIGISPPYRDFAMALVISSLDHSTIEWRAEQSIVIHATVR